MGTNLPKISDLLVFCIHSLNFSLEFFIMMFFVTNQLNISEFLPPRIRKTSIVNKKYPLKFSTFNNSMDVIRQCYAMHAYVTG